MAYRPRARKSAPKGVPDHEAESVSVKAFKFSDVDKFPRSKTHGGQQITASGDIEVKVKRGLFGKNKDVRPEPGAILVGSSPDQQVTVTARRIEKQNSDNDGRKIVSASSGVKIFGRLRRRSG